MLVLKVKKDARVFIGPDIVLTILAGGDGGMRIGIDAPKDVDIQREELLKEGDPRLVRAEAK